jgi:hypothetical protein
MATVSLKSRYKDTTTYFERGGVEVMGPFQAPAEFDKPGRSWLVHVVQEFEIGFPDIIVVKYYGAGAEQLWWAVCLVNGIIDPDLDIIAGQRLLIPPRDLVSRYAARRSRD